MIYLGKSRLIDPVIDDHSHITMCSKPTNIGNYDYNKGVFLYFNYNNGVYGSYRSHGVHQNHPVVMDDHDLGT